MHAGCVKSSLRLQKTMLTLSDNIWHTTREISQKTGSMAVHSDIAGLRANGVRVLSERRKGQPTRIWQYQIPAF